MAVRIFNQSFAGGELSKEMLGRIGDVKFQTGAALCQNFVVTPQGPLENRGGTSMVRQAKFNQTTRVISFVFSVDQTMVVEIGESYFRFHTQGKTLVTDTGVPYEVAHPYLQEDIMDIHHVQSNDVLTLVHPKYPPAELRRLSATEWEYKVISFMPKLTPPGSVALSMYIPTSAVVNVDTYTDFNYQVVAVGGGSESIASATATVSTNLYVTGAKVTITWTAVAGAEYYNVYKETGGGIFGYIGQTKELTLVDDNIAPDNDITPKIVDNIFEVAGRVVSVPVIAGGVLYGSDGGRIVSATIGSDTGVAVGTPLADPFSIIDGAPQNGLKYTITDPFGFDASFTTVGRYSGSRARWVLGSITITAPGKRYTGPTISFAKVNPAAASPYVERQPIIELQVSSLLPTIEIADPTGSGAVLKAVVVNEAITEIIVEAGGDGYSSPTVSIIDPAGGSGAVFGAPVLAATGDYPNAVTYFEQRRVFGGTPNKPQQIWMSRSGTESDFSYGIPLRDDDRISFRVAARENNTVRHLVPVGNLLALTQSAEWQVTSVNSDAITPTSISVKPQSYVGVSNVQPVIVNNTVICAAERGGHVMELGYRWESNGYSTGDVSLRAAHLFDYQSIRDMAYQKSPMPIVWCTSSSGKLLGFTYVPDQQIGGWHQHVTRGGAFESCCCVSEDGEDILYVVVRRDDPVSGEARRFIERMASRQVLTREDSFFVDCGLTYDSDIEETEFSGLDHLEGQVVAILADGAVYPQQTVVNGAVTIDNPARKVHVGLPIDAQMQTLPVSLQVDYAYGVGRWKNINEVALRVIASEGMKIGSSLDALTEPNSRQFEPYGTAPFLKTEIIPVTVMDDWNLEGQIYVVQDAPLPLSIVSLAATLEVGGG